MNIRDLLKEDSVILNEHSQTKEEVIEKLVNRHYLRGHIKDKKSFLNAILSRENISSTAIGNMVAIPHAQDETVNYLSLVALVDPQGVDYELINHEPVKIFFMIAVPKNYNNDYLEILSKLNQVLKEKEIINLLLKVKKESELISILSRKIEELEQKESLERVENKEEYDVVALTACQTGIIHTYIAAKSLEDNAKRLGIKIKVETHGASGIKNLLTEEDIKNARCVIIATDKKISMKRFSKKPIIKTSVEKGIHEAQQLLEEAMKKDNENVKAMEIQEEIIHNNLVNKIICHPLNVIYKIVPILMIYSIFTIIASKYLTLNYYSSQYPYQMSFASLVDFVRMFSLYFAEILICGYIAESISDYQGFIIGSISAILMTSNDISVIEIIIMGFIIGYMVIGLKKIFSYIPDIVGSIVSNILIPTIGITIAIFLILIFPKITSEFDNQITQIIFNPFIGGIIGFALGTLMTFDKNHLFHKGAYFIGIIGIFLERYDIMSAVMVSGMIPSLAIGMTMYIFPEIINKEEKIKNWRYIVEGLCFDNSEAGYYIKNDKTGIRLPCMIASGLAGALSMIFGCTQMFPHGGIFVLPFINHAHLFFIALLASSFVGVALIVLLRKNTN